jgi:FixJ family two-component response regulator
MADMPSEFVVAAVDDDPSILRSLAYLLESADYSVRLFTSATAFIYSECLPEIDCLISDIDMPGADGFDLLRYVDTARPGLPTILITGYPERLKRMPSHSEATARIFVKPFQASELLGAVSAAIRNPQK